MPSLNNENALHREILAKRPSAQDDPARNPDGIYSGMTKRLANTDGSFCGVTNIPKDTRNRGRLT